MYRFRDNYVYVMYYVYVTSGPSLLIESTDSMIMYLLLLAAKCTFVFVALPCVSVLQLLVVFFLLLDNVSYSDGGHLHSQILQ